MGFRFRFCSGGLRHGWEFSTLAPGTCFFLCELWRTLLYHDSGQSLDALIRSSFFKNSEIVGIGNVLLSFETSLAMFQHC